MEKQNKKRRPPMSPPVEAMLDTPPSHTDVQGMYTGVPWDEQDEPVQDADDL